MMLHSRIIGPLRTAAVLAVIASSPAAFAESAFPEAPDLAPLAIAHEEMWDTVRSSFDYYLRNADPEWVSDVTPDLGGPDVWILSLYDDGVTTSGTGTIVLGDDGAARVMTAGHVVSWEMEPLSIPRTENLVSSGRGCAVAPQLEAAGLSLLKYSHIEHRAICEYTSGEHRHRKDAAVWPTARGRTRTC